MSAAIATRPTLPVCPDWCLGHDGDFQDWETLTDGSGQIRGHAGRSVQIGNVSVFVSAIEREDGVLDKPTVDMWVDFGQSAELTEAQAHELGMALVRAGDMIRRWVRSCEDDDRGTRARNAFELGRDYERGLRNTEARA